MDKEEIGCGICGKILVKGVDYTRTPSDMCLEHRPKPLDYWYTSPLETEEEPSDVAVRIVPAYYRKSSIIEQENENQKEYDFEEEAPKPYGWMDNGI